MGKRQFTYCSIRGWGTPAACWLVVELRCCLPAAAIQNGNDGCSAGRKPRLQYLRSIHPHATT